MRNLLIILALALALFCYTTWQNMAMADRALEVSQGGIIMFSMQG